MVVPTIMPANSVSGYDIDNSLRFNNDDSARLTFTPSSAGNRRTFTVSVWVKLQAGTTGERCFLAADDGTGGNNNFHYMAINPADRLHLYMYEGAEEYVLTGSPLLRDPSAWYHLVVAFDTTQGTDTNRIKMYINGSQVTSFSTTNYPSQNHQTRYNNNNAQRIGSYPDQDQSYFDGYMAEYHLVDGQQLTPSDFGEYNDNGVWIPKEYEGSYGTNGFYLEFKETGTDADASGIGADTSGNDNHWAPVNLVASDVVIDTPTNNFATMNPLLTDTTTVAFSEGNLKIVATNASTAGSSIAVQNGKWYVEMICTAKTATNALMGISTVDGFDGQRQLDESQNGGSGHGYVMNATKLPGGASYGASWAVDDIMAIALDLDTAQNTVTFYKNNASQGAIDIDNALYVFATGNGQGSATVTMNINFGADDTFAGEITSAGNTDANGEGLFKYTPPSGYYALNTKNLGEFG